MDSGLLVDLLNIGRLCLQLGRVRRATLHEDGERPESDTDHTVMLSVLACTFAEQCAPHLDLGLIVQFATVHDLPEAEAGDVNTLLAGAAEVASKREREAAALGGLRARFGQRWPWLHSTIERYERLDTPEARFVKILDKAMPCVTHMWNGGASLRRDGVGLEKLREVHARVRGELAATCGADQPAAMQLLAAVHEALERLVEALQ